jgi:hypothetical protein
VDVLILSEVNPTEFRRSFLLYSLYFTLIFSEDPMPTESFGLIFNSTTSLSLRLCSVDIATVALILFAVAVT